MKAILLAVLALAPAAAALPAPLPLSLDSAPETGAAHGFPPSGEVDETSRGYRLDFDCPSSGPFAPPCPTRVADGAHVFGAPALAVNPSNPRHVAIAALAGTLAGSPTPASRAGTPHALLVSEDGGLTFATTPIPAPQDDLLGEEVALVADDEGNLVLAALWSRRGETGPTVLGVWKLGPFPGTAALASPPAILAPWTEGAVLSRISLSLDDGTVFLAWQEHGLARDARSAHGPSGFVDVAWSTADPAAPWQRLSDEHVMGPCAGASNAHPHRGLLFVACTAQPGLEGERLEIGDIAILALDPAAGNTSYRGRLPFAGDLFLLPADNDRLGLLAFEQRAGDRVRAVFTVSKDGSTWSSARDFGRALREPTDPPAREARILAVTRQATSDTYHVIYQEIPVANQSDPNQGTPLAELAPRVRKQLFAFAGSGELAYRRDLAVDLPENRMRRDLVHGAFNESFAQDRADAIVLFGSREFVAYSDAGSLVVGELRETVSVPLGPSPVPLTPSKTETAITQPPKREFTLPFLLVGGALGAAIVARVLVGRVKVTTKELPAPGEKKP